jgi:hypothetical protein
MTEKHLEPGYRPGSVSRPRSGSDLGLAVHAWASSPSQRRDLQCRNACPRRARLVWELDSSGAALNPLGSGAPRPERQSYHRVRRVSRAIADLAGSESIEPMHPCRCNPVPAPRHGRSLETIGLNSESLTLVGDNRPEFRSIVPIGVGPSRSARSPSTGFSLRV